MHCFLANLPNWIQSLAAVGLVFLTFWTLKVLRGYATDTATIAKSGIEQIEKMDRPFVALLQKPAEHLLHGGGWAIENLGKGAAINIRHTVLTGEAGLWVETVSPLAVGAFSWLPAFNIEVMRNFVFTIECDSLTGKRYRTVIDWPDGAMRTHFEPMEP
ncbi:MAG TPA: hypothetical protein VK763_13765 [Terriglobales bacterium]|jgi:hypothetical protein|nr:hypothetical protein [Terriglobales bacterium]